MKKECFDDGFRVEGRLLVSQSLEEFVRSRAPDAAQRSFSGALLSRGPSLRSAIAYGLWGRPEHAPRPSRRPLRGLLRMRLSRSAVCRHSSRTLRPHPEGPPEAGVSKDGPRASYRNVDVLAAASGLRPPPGSGAGLRHIRAGPCRWHRPRSAKRRRSRGPPDAGARAWRRSR